MDILKKNTIEKFIFSAVSLVVVFILFKPAFSAYFFQDDWFSFLISRASSLRDFLLFFLPRPDVIYYRPLGMQIPFFIVQNLWGISPLPFRIGTLLIHVVNGYMVYLLLFSLVKQKLFSYWGAFLYLTSATHGTIFYWAATFAFILAPFFYFSTFLYFIKEKYRISILLFFFGLLANELLITVPLLLTIYLLLNKKYQNLKRTFPYWMLVIAYIVLRFAFAKPPTQNDYAFVMSIKYLLINIRNYLLWSFNWPETISDQFLKFFQFNPEFIQNFSYYFRFWVLETLLVVFLCVIMPALLLIRYKKLHTQVMKILVFGSLWFLVSLLPIIFFSNHAFTYYVPIPLFGFILIWSYFLNYLETIRPALAKKMSYLLFITAGVWFFTSYQTISLNQFIHWAPQRAQKSRALIEKITTRFPDVPDDKSITLEGEDLENAKIVLSNQNGLRVIYDDMDIQTKYGDPQTDL